MDRPLRSRLTGFTLVLLVFLAVRALFVLSAADVFFYAEEMEKGAAAKALIDGLDVPYAQLPFHLYEGGGFVISHLKALAFLCVGENLLAHKLVALFTSTLVLAAGYAFCARHVSRCAAVVFGLLFTFGPSGFQRLSLLSLGIHFEALFFMYLVLDTGLKLLRSEGEPARRDLVLLGLAGGFGVYFSYQVALAVGWIAIAALIARRSLFAPRPLLLGLASFAVGLAPWLAMVAAVGLGPMRDIHGGRLYTSWAAGFGDLANLWQSILDRPMGDLLLVSSSPVGFAILSVAWLRRGEPGDRVTRAFLAGFALLFTAAWIKSGSVTPRLAQFLDVKRLAPLYGVGLVAAAAGVDRLLRRGPRARILAFLAAGGLLVAGVWNARLILAGGRLQDMPANLAFLTGTKGYSYVGYFATVLARREGDVVANARPYLGFDEPARDLLLTDLVHAAFARDRRKETWAASPPSARALDPVWYVGEFGRMIGAGEAPGVLLGAGPALARASRRDLDRAFTLASMQPEPARTLYLRAVGRYGTDLSISPERVASQASLFAGRSGAGPLLEGIGWRIFRKFVVEASAAEIMAGGVIGGFACKPAAALEWIRALDSRAAPHVEAGFMRAWDEYRLPTD